MYFIFSGKVHSGKTTRLIEWSKNQKNVGGILAPIINGKRNLVSIKPDERKILEVDSIIENKNIISVGKYFFDEDVFNWGREILLNSFSDNIDWLVIDEVGILELNGKGLEPAVSKIINESSYLSKMNILFVVRENLYEDFFLHFNINKEEVKNFIL